VQPYYWLFGFKFCTVNLWIPMNFYISTSKNKQETKEGNIIRGLYGRNNIPTDGFASSY
jgi:hypothetical protein